MKVIVNAPPPAPRPPMTYDLLGLTEEQMELLQVVLGQGINAIDELYGAIYEALGKREPKRKAVLRLGSKMGDSFTYEVKSR